MINGGSNGWRSVRKKTASGARLVAPKLPLEVAWRPLKKVCPKKPRFAGRSSQRGYVGTRWHVQADSSRLRQDRNMRVRLRTNHARSVSSVRRATRPWTKRRG